MPSKSKTERLDRPLELLDQEGRLRAEFERGLRRCLYLREDRILAWDVSLQEYRVDRIGYEGVQICIEQLFGFKFLPELVNESTFATAESLWQAVRAMTASD